MTDLQASLIGIGGAIVVGVISYNKWQEHKAKKSVERAFSSAPEDVLMTSAADLSAAGNERREPVFIPSRAEAQFAEDASGQIVHDPLEASDNLIPSSSKELPVDQLIDCSIPLGMDSPARGEKILPVIQSLRHIGNKPVHFIGQRDDGDWESIAYGGVYTALQAGVQLANRSSALNELEYSELVMRLRQVGDELGAEPDVPDMSKVMTASRGLHQFVSEYDAQLSVNVHANGASWAVNTLLAALERQGFDLRPDGRLVMPDGDGGVLFSLSTNVTLAAETTSRLTLLLDVPRVAPSRDGFGAMIACSKSLAARLDGTVVDDANQPLSDAALDEIAAQVNAFYDDMETAEIPAGSTRALRLFS
ncbi:MAG: cell division protein [Herminiimonas sp.]|nr:cell division protein [Herminiimonas sp.]